MAKTISSCILAFTVLCFTVTGCNNKVAENKPTTSKSDDEQPSVSTETHSVAVSPAVDVESPAADSSQLPPAEASPKEVCERFMNNLQNGNRIGAENLLTKAALTITSREGLVLEPMGGPNSTYVFGDVRYATNEQKLAQIDCSVVDNTNGEEYKLDMTWLAKKQKLGWRISGVMLQLEPGEIKDYLSFENLSDVQKMKSLASGDVTEDESADRQAQQSQSDLK